ncbi:MFS transporter [Photobacterium kishitanii]|uniref:MFS transporter n=1 Tax=Photobacterium kishitanii TaxID=318456 RepID=A0A0B7JAI0_9GAMM|nr:MFS transporter [Photobacterium kishitanii]OBU20596.1 MFS transporter [Photobacterium kishitanii]PSU98913.1 MFS transporter [Photobacterium kishitanii]PSV18649.1 MFS transporter [Photobacterium kishitanii]PSW70150.1 MFS transporter [Photobacterium kishitanii]CEO39004.1 Major Facilitator Superfamily protein [Photobacterium kishitanii]
MNIKKISTPLAIALLMFPQLIETMYSPALTSIKNHFAVSAENAAQGLSIFFMAFAFGVVFWGRLCDIIGRRYSTLAGLALFIIAAIFTYLAPNFDLFLFGFGSCAFGAAVGSVCTQTILRDSFEGAELSRLFSIAATSVGISPVIGMIIGSWLTSHGDYTWVFAAMIVLIALLFIWSSIQLPETKPENIKRDSLLSVANKMIRDSHIWYITLMIGFANVALFSYYSIAPFMFEQLGASVKFFGYTGFVLAIGSVLGSLINMKLIRYKLNGDSIVFIAMVLMVISGIGVYLLQHTIWFFIPMALVSVAFGLALPNLFSTALTNYRNHLGSAGALLGLSYYLIIGFGLDLAASIGNLAITLLTCGCCCLLLVCIKQFLTKLTQLRNAKILTD